MNLRAKITLAKQYGGWAVNAGREVAVYFPSVDLKDQFLARLNQQVRG